MAAYTISTHGTGSVAGAVPQLPSAGSGGPLQMARDAFAALCGQRPELVVRVEVTDRVTASSSVVPVGELLEVLWSKRTSRAAGRAVWCQMLAKAAAGRPEWSLAVVGLAYPVLRRTATRLAGEFPFADEHDLEAQLVAEFLTRAFAEDPARLAHQVRNVPGFLASRAHTAVRRAMASWREDAGALSLEQVRESGVDPAAPSPDGGLRVLERAVAAGVISDVEAELIAASRIDGVAVDKAAGKRSRATGYRVRAAAEARLAAWILGERDQPHLVRPAD